MNQRHFLIDGDARMAIVLAFLERLPATPERPLEVIVSAYRGRASAAQYRFYWGRRMQQIADQVWVDGKRFEAESWHELFKRRFIGSTELPDGSQRALSTTMLTPQEFGDYVTKIEAFVIEQYGVIFEDEAR